MIRFSLMYCRSDSLKTDSPGKSSAKRRAVRVIKKIRGRFLMTS
jgi:hypothetical protein